MVVDFPAITTANGTEPTEASTAVWTHDALLAATFPKPKPLIRGILDEGSINSWSGPGGIGKSLLALDAARSIAGCQRFLDSIPTALGPVLLIDQESSPAMLQDRLRLMQQARPIPERSPLTVVVPEADVRLDEAVGYAQLDQWMRQYQPVLTILDSFTRFHSANENDAIEMAGVNRNLRQLVRDHGTAVLLIDHTRKPGLNDSPETRLRGSTEKRNILDTGLDIAAPRPEEPVLTITMTKRRWAAPLPPFSVLVVADDRGLRLVHDGEAATWSGIDTGNKIVQAVNDLRTHRGADSADIKGIMALLGIAEGTARSHLTRLVQAGILSTRQVPSGGGRPRTVYDPEGGRE
ncbi:MAG: AAA family ATPase [Chloroflexota bacterium]|nr:AAA family ATPase [Chloroflexota bacterium]